MFLPSVQKSCSLSCLARGGFWRTLSNSSRVNPFELRRKRNRLFDHLWELGRYTR